MEPVQLLIISIISGFISFLLFRKLFNRSPKLTPHTSTPGRYTALFPTQPQESSQKINTAEGKITLYIAQVKGRFHQFIVSYCDYPQHVVDASFPEKMLDGSRDGAVKNVHGELLSETLFDFPGSEVEGRELHIKVNPKAALRMRMMLVGRRLYQLQAISAPGRVFDKTVVEFFGGFRVT